MRNLPDFQFPMDATSHTSGSLLDSETASVITTKAFLMERVGTEEVKETRKIRILVALQSKLDSIFKKYGGVAGILPLQCGCEWSSNL